MSAKKWKKMLSRRQCKFVRFNPIKTYFDAKTNKLFRLTRTEGIPLALVARPGRIELTHHFDCIMALQCIFDSDCPIQSNWCEPLISEKYYHRSHHVLIPPKYTCQTSAGNSSRFVDAFFFSQYRNRFPVRHAIAIDHTHTYFFFHHSVAQFTHSNFVAFYSVCRCRIDLVCFFFCLHLSLSLSSWFVLFVCLISCLVLFSSSLGIFFCYSVTFLSNRWIQLL